MRVSSAAFLALSALLAAPSTSHAQQARTFTRADTVRGTNGPARSWWDVTFYDLFVSVNPADSSIVGRNAITFRGLRPTGTGSEMQIDLQTPLVVDSVVRAPFLLNLEPSRPMDSVAVTGSRLDFRRDGNAYFIEFLGPPAPGETRTITVYYHGKPRVATNPPWDGGFIWQRDSVGNTWVATANQGLGASAWWPNKDYLGDEPDSQRVAIRVPDPMMDVSNGRLRRSTLGGDGTTTYEWFVASPINNYNVTVNAGRYAHWQETYEGENGPLTMDFWPLAVNELAARRQWVQARPMMRCFEHWLGPFPWYQDGYKIVETPHLGMEHQSAIAYGNRYLNGYRGRDLSGTGHGLQWDFILVHESAHEWFGNNITVQDNAELWVHESFANYAESLYTECLTGSKEAGAEYVIGTRANVVNDRPIVGAMGVNDEGSGDMYYKGGNMLHTIRQLVNDDERWRAILRGLNRDFARQTITGAQVQDYIARESGVKLDKVFEQYLHTTRIPVLEYSLEGRTLSYRWANVVAGFDMPVRIAVAPDAYSLVRPTETWQSATTELDSASEFRVDPNFYVTVREARP